MLASIILISISLSLDALGIGISYKLKGVNITNVAKIVIGLVSVAVMWVSLTLGELVLCFMPLRVANILGISILILIGLTFIRNAILGNGEKTYDFNKSKNIDWWEALLLGVALSADSISTGIAAVTMGLSSHLIPFCVGGMQVLFLYMAQFLVNRIPWIKKMNRKVCGVVSGILLIVIALLRVII